MTGSDLFREILEDTRHLIQKEAKRGVLRLSPEVAERLERLDTSAPAVPDPAPAIPEPVFAVPEPAVVSPELDDLAKIVSGCMKCRLCETRTQTVFGDGNPNAELVFVGEAPGRDEDLRGLPFVGRAGQLLTDIIVKGMKLRRSDVYICNVLKCRPPENRDPRPDEIEQCEPYLVRQLELIQPKVICALGGHAAKTLLRTTEATGRLRGRWHFYHGIPLRVTFHPAYLLRNPADKQKTWDDIQQVMKVLNGQITPSPEPGSISV